MILKHKIRDTIKKMIMRNIISESKTCHSVNDNLSLAYSFFSTEYSIRPFQIKTEIKTLLKILETNKPQTLLEIGTANGGTLFLFSKIATKDALLISIDLPSGQFGGEFYPEWKMHLYQSFANYDQKIVTIRENSHSHDTLESVMKLLGGQSVDFLFIDGDHTYEGVKKDYESYLSLMKKDGIIGFHDINPGPKELVGGVPDFWQQVCFIHKSIEIIDDSNSTGGYGIGLLFLDNDGENVKYENALKIMTSFKENDDVVIEKNHKSLSFQIKNFPLMLTLVIYFRSKKYFLNKNKK
jgi:predicted O-methyltransferase YrrM